MIQYIMSVRVVLIYADVPYNINVFAQKRVSDCILCLSICFVWQRIFFMPLKLSGSTHMVDIITSFCHFDLHLHVSTSFFHLKL